MEIKLQNLKPVTHEVIWPPILICFSKLSEEQGNKFARYFKFSFFPHNSLFSIELLRSLTWS